MGERKRLNTLELRERLPKRVPPFIESLAEARRIGVHEGWYYHHVQAILIAIDHYAEAAMGNREYFWNRPPLLMGSSRQNS
ncbi:hypothetical protein ACQR2B_27965 [Bradyrhizobium oligotrophicum]|uniref:hypothetical protein n=1 Tax=Bradyrhizobium TaxID=374 RepID=UPI003EB700D5